MAPLREKVTEEKLHKSQSAIITNSLPGNSRSSLKLVEMGVRQRGLKLWMCQIDFGSLPLNVRL
jgi:hypothetical protein